MPPLQWDMDIAATATRWATSCPNGHSGAPALGENMAWGYASIGDVVDAWYNEVSCCYK